MSQSSLFERAFTPFNVAVLVGSIAISARVAGAILLRRRPGRSLRPGPVRRWSALLVAALVQFATVATGAAPAAAADLGTVSVAAEVSVDEPVAGVAYANFAVTLDRTGSGLVSVDYATADGTATADADYVPRTGTLQFNGDGAQQVRIVRIPVLFDAWDEAAETFSLALSNPFNADLGTDTGIATITDDSNDVARLRVSDATVTEGDSGPATAHFVVTLSAPSEQTIEVTADTADGSGGLFDAAEAGSDYTAVSGQTVTFAPGDVSAVVDVTVTGDSTDENTETFTVNLSDATAGATITDASGRGTIVDDDGPPTISIADAAPVSEGDSGTVDATFTVSLAEASTSEVRVRASTVDGTAAGGSDYTPILNHLITFAPGATTQDVVVAVAGDTTNEADETFSVVLTSPSLGAVIVDGTATGTITDDDDGPEISIASPDPKAEGDLVGAVFSFPVTLPAASGQTVTVDYTVSDGTAEAVEDYLAISGTVTFLPGDTSETIAVAAVGDLEPEAAETFTVTLSDPSAGAAIAAGGGTATGTIVNDDGPPGEISADDPALPHTEGNTGTTPVTVTIRLENAPLLPVTANWTTVDGTARAGSDYEAASGTIVFAGDGSFDVNINVIGDALDEDDETFFVEITDTFNAVAADPSATVTIADDDAPPAVSIAGLTVDEGDDGLVTPVTVEATLDAPSAKTVTVGYAVGGGDATAGTDYSAVPSSGTLTFEPGETAQSITIDVIGDDLDEIDETVPVVLSVDGGSNATLGTASGGVTITDDDDPPVVSVADAADVAEDDLPAASVFVVSLSAPSGKTVTVDYATADGTAGAPDDYTTKSGALTFLPDKRTWKRVTVTVIDDALADSAAVENYTLELSDPSNATLSDTAASGTGTILDDEAPPTLSVDPSTATVTEGGAGTTTTVTFGVRLVPAAEAEVTVDYTTADGAGPDAATAGDDYTETSGTLTFTAGDTEGSVTVTVAGDATDETDETFTFTLSNASGADLVGGGATLSATATIVDDDGPAISVTGPAPVTEGNSGTVPATFTVSLSSASPQPVTVDYATADGTATAGSDYTAVSGTLTFAPGETSKTVAVSVQGDTTNEFDETFTLTLSDPVDASLGTAVAGATIKNDDAVSVSVNDVSVVEGDSGTTPAAFTVSLSAGTGVAVTVDYATANGTATAPADYSSTSGTLTFAPGETTKSVSVAVKGDTTDSATEKFSLVLSSPSSTAVIGDGVGEGTIIDDDPLVSVSVGDVTVTEGTSTTTDTDATFTVRLSGARLKPTSVAFETVPGTAGPGADYTAVSGTVTLAAGQTSTTVTVKVHADANHEADERFTLRLFSPVGAVLGDAEGAGTILDDDPAAYALVGADGSVFPFGDVDVSVSLGGPINQPIVAATPTASGRGYWLFAADGAVFALGDAGYYGSMGGRPLNQPIVGAAVTPSGKGYWMAAADGGMFTFGDAGFHGSMGATPLNQPVVAMTSTPSGKGYWMAAADGGMFTFGDAGFHGSMGATPLNRPVASMTATPTGRGYWLVAGDGGLFSFGDAVFLGSTARLPLPAPIVALLEQ